MANFMDWLDKAIKTPGEVKSSGTINEQFSLNQKQRDFMQTLDNAKMEMKQNAEILRQKQKADYLSDLALREETTKREEKLAKQKAQAAFEQKLLQAKETANQDINLQTEATEKLRSFAQKEQLREQTSKPLFEAEGGIDKKIPDDNVLKKFGRFSKEVWRKLFDDYKIEQKDNKLMAQASDGKYYEVKEFDPETGEPIVYIVE